MKIKKGEFEAGIFILIAGLLLFSMIAIFAGQGFQSNGPENSEQKVNNFRTGSDGVWSRISELEVKVIL